MFKIKIILIMFILHFVNVAILEAKILSVKEYNCEEPTDSEFNLLKEHPIVNDLIILKDKNRYVTFTKYLVKLKRIKTENSEFLEYTYKYDDTESFFLSIKENTLKYEGRYNFFIDMPKETNFKYELFGVEYTEDLILLGKFKGLLVLINSPYGFENGLPKGNIFVEICKINTNQ